MNGADKPDLQLQAILPRTGELNMSDQNQEKPKPSGKAPKHSDTEAGLQEELRREAAEGGDSVGDVGSNRTLSGSSSWETLPSQEENDGADDSATKGTNDD